MDNKTALFLALVIIAIFVTDWLFLGWDLHLEIARRTMQLIEWLAFWR